MDEHDDDLESTVHEGAKVETESFLDDEDELDDTDAASDDVDDVDLDQDDTEL